MNNDSNKEEDIRNVKMTEEEKKTVWDGVLRRVTDYPPGEYPFERKPSTWDGIFRRKTDVVDGKLPQSIDEDASSEDTK
ncbi:MAG: hypothetical protein RIQ41_450 [Candidatus Parcubacteria bacterium]|jgi:hypothetical protein